MIKRQLYKCIVCLMAAIVACGFASGQSAAQYVVTSSGGTSKAISGYAVDFTIGQPITATIGTNPIFTQGIQQPTISIVLPLTLLSFNATKQNNGNLLVWQTANEQHTAMFLLEKSIGNAQAFTTIGSITAMGSGDHSYNYTDVTKNTVSVFYRIKMMDINGQFTYSNSVAIINNDSRFMITGIYPNPVKAILNVNIQLSNAAPATFTITDFAGRQLLQEKHDINQATIQALDVSTLAAGTYFLTIDAGIGKAASKFIKL